MAKPTSNLGSQVSALAKAGPGENLGQTVSAMARAQAQAHGAQAFGPGGGPSSPPDVGGPGPSAGGGTPPPLPPTPAAPSGIPDLLGMPALAKNRMREAS